MSENGNRRIGASGEGGRSEPPPDPELASLLRELEGPVPTLHARALRRRIAVRAADPLSRRAGTDGTWWRHAARWSRAGIPIAAAACLLLGVAMGRTDPPDATGGTREAPGPGWVTAEVHLERLLLGELGPAVGGEPTGEPVGARSLSELLLLDALREE